MSTLPSGKNHGKRKKTDDSTIIWLVVWNMNFIFPYIVIPTDFHIFRRTGSTTNQLSFRSLIFTFEAPFEWLISSHDGNSRTVTGGVASQRVLVYPVNEVGLFLVQKKRGPSGKQWMVIRGSCGFTRFFLIMFREKFFRWGWRWCMGCLRKKSIEINGHGMSWYS